MLEKLAKDDAEKYQTNLETVRSGAERRPAEDHANGETSLNCCAFASTHTNSSARTVSLEITSPG
ncbi:hypothetical protein KCP76_16300 [Salmonella enterica subsp. enterica serovar Weltevreden]|nr:hypothetical protein KCP76_16300 [Salmonella enterica subsp. enterica serovar Weltevreden]